MTGPYDQQRPRRRGASQHPPGPPNPSNPPNPQSSRNPRNPRNPQHPPGAQSSQQPQRPQRPRRQPRQQPDTHSSSGRYSSDYHRAVGQPPSSRRPPERRPRPPGTEGQPRRRRSPNAGVYPDEHPTDIVNVDYDALFGDEEDAPSPAQGGPGARKAPGGEQRRRRRRREEPVREESPLPELSDDEPEGRVERDRKRAGKRFLGWMAALTVIVLLAGGAFYGARELLGYGFDDYSGTGERDVLLQVEDGDTTGAIAGKLARMDVVASSEAFVVASENDERVLAIQPGYYTVKTKMSGENAVELLVEDTSRVGVFQLRAGTQLDDVKRPDGSSTPGVFSLLSKASCADLNGKSTCVSVKQLRNAAATTKPADLGVPDWTIEALNDVEPGRKLEGLIAPGVYDVKPGWDAKRLLTEVIAASTIRLQAAGLPDSAESTGYSPYEVLIMASIVEREGVEADFGKISRVIYNRLHQGIRLGMDSTVNYILHQPDIRTTTSDHRKAGAYNSYGEYGLVPTPISAPSPEALTAALKPPKGKWLYFVKCETNGLSCFSTTYDEHLRKANEAEQRGVY